MKKSIVFLTTLMLTLSGCTIKLPGMDNSVSLSIDSTSIIPTSIETSADSQITISDDYLSDSVEDVSISNDDNSHLASDSLTSTVISNEPRYVDFYAINDFHGAVLENSDNKEPGIVKLGAYLKEKKSEGNTLLLNSGDMWQGAIESNYNRGNLLTDCMNEIEFDCFTLGNHEFDWGQYYIQTNRNRSSTTGYQTPFLAANIYDYDINTKRIGDFANLGDKYTIRELDNGLKVGIIGVIGKDQITSITSQFVDDINFNDPTSIIKTLSDELRINQGVDVVILDCHTDQYSITGSSESNFLDRNNLTSISSSSHKRYVDAVFCAHTHEDKQGEINGVPFIQGECYGRKISNVQLRVDVDGSVTCEKSENLVSMDVTNGYFDDDLNDLVTTYKTSSDVASNEVLGTFSGTFMASGTLPNLVCEAIANTAKSSGYNIDYSVVNNARSSVSSGTVTYGELYRALPFDNEIYIIKTTGTALKKEFGYSSIYMYRENKESLDENKEYTIAVIDYLATHRNSNRDYNYFPGMTILGRLEKSGYDLYNYRDITAEYIKSKKNLNYYNYTSQYNDQFNKDKLTTSI